MSIEEIVQRFFLSIICIVFVGVVTMTLLTLFEWIFKI